MAAILIPHIAGSQASSFRSASAKDAMMALAPNSLYQLYGSWREDFALIASIARTLPAFHLDLSEDPKEIATTIRAFIETLFLKERGASFRSLNFVKPPFGDVDLHTRAYLTTSQRSEAETGLWSRSVRTKLLDVDVPCAEPDRSPGERHCPRRPRRAPSQRLAGGQRPARRRRQHRLAAGREAGARPGGAGAGYARPVLRARGLRFPRSQRKHSTFSGRRRGTAVPTTSRPSCSATRARNTRWSAASAGASARCTIARRSRRPMPRPDQRRPRRRCGGCDYRRRCRTAHPPCGTAWPSARGAPQSGGIEARTGLRMMPTSPRSPLSFRTAGFPQYGWKAGLSGGAFPSPDQLKPAPGMR